MSQYTDQKLQILLELAEFDPNLLLLSSILGSKKFGILLKSFSGTTVKFPTTEEMRQIAKKVGLYRRSFKRLVQEHGRNTKISHLAQIGLMIDHKDVRKAVKARMTMAILQEYLKKIFEDDSFEITVEDLAKADTQEKIKLYELHIKELAHRTNMFKQLTNLKKN